MRLVLASTSPYRRALLERLGLPFEQVAPGVDEEAVKALGLAPRALAEELALAKARAALAAAGEGAVVIGSDQVCAVGERVLDKPGDEARALEQLALLAGREHELVTAVAVVGAGGPDWRHTVVARLAMRALDGAALARYAAADRPFDCAGSYKLESRGVALFERVDCPDHTAVVGLPLIALVGELARRGFQLP